MMTRLLVVVAWGVLALGRPAPAQEGSPAGAAPERSAPVQPDFVAGTAWTGESSLTNRANRRAGQLVVTSREGDAFRGEWASWVPDRPADVSRWVVEGSLGGTALEWRTVEQLSGIDAGDKTAYVTLEREGRRFSGTWRVPALGRGWKGRLWIERASPSGVALPRMVHAWGYHGDDGLRRLAGELPALREREVGTLVLEVGYGFAFRSHPDVASGPSPVTRNGARAFAAACDEQGVRLVPLVSCIGRQGWSGRPAGLLAAYPGLAVPRDGASLPEGAPLEWSPRDERAWDVVLALLDEVVDAFGADALHVGLDAIRLPRTEGADAADRDPGRVLADAVLRLHEHFAEDGVELWMWSEALLPPELRDEGAPALPTHGAVARVPDDVVVCDLHDDDRDEHASAAYLLEHGLAVVPASASSLSTLRGLVEASLGAERDRVVGVMIARWNHRRGGGRAGEPTFLDAAVEMLEELSGDR